MCTELAHIEVLVLLLVLSSLLRLFTTSYCASDRYLEELNGKSRESAQVLRNHKLYELVILVRLELILDAGDEI